MFLARGAACRTDLLDVDFAIRVVVLSRYWRQSS